MTRKGIAFQPQTLEPLTLDDESGLLPTPPATEYGANHSVLNDGRTANRRAMARAKFPTPRSHESGDYQRDNGDPAKPRLTLNGVVKLWPTPRSEDSQCAGNHPNAMDSLHAAVKLWPTPPANDANNVTRQSGAFQSLTRQVQTFRTPQKRDWKGTTSEKWANRENGDNTPSLADQVGGQLNPTWVEWLMGYPSEWTVLRRSATPSSRSARRK